MLSRENVEIMAVGRTFYYCVPIPKKVINSCPMPDNVNFEAIDCSFKKSIAPSYFKAAVNYELDYRESIYKTIIREYSEDIEWFEMIHLLFKRLSINPDIFHGRARTIENCLDSFEQEIEKSGLEDAGQKFISMFAQKRDAYFSIDYFFNDKKTYFKSVSQRYKEEFEKWSKHRIGRVINPAQK
ncbi:MAG: hypothetical protein PHT91_03845, partial [Candidatus Nanoarchaeia archaeon]|nr:hypothetical protein [Candidatus Nanoarchaeia archaeon]